MDEFAVDYTDCITKQYRYQRCAHLVEYAMGKPLWPPCTCDIRFSLNDFFHSDVFVYYALDGTSLIATRCALIGCRTTCRLFSVAATLRAQLRLGAAVRQFVEQASRRVRAFPNYQRPGSTSCDDNIHIYCTIARCWAKKRPLLRAARLRTRCLTTLLNCITMSTAVT